MGLFKQEPDTVNSKQRRPCQYRRVLNIETIKPGKDADFVFFRPICVFQLDPNALAEAMRVKLYDSVELGTV